MMFSSKPDKAAERQSKLLTAPKVVAFERPGQSSSDGRQDE